MKQLGYDFLMAHVGEQSDECVVWPNSCCTAGYGCFFKFGKVHLAHRYMCELTNGPAPEGHQAAHSCGNRRCINPRHLSWKTPAENQLDRRQHGTLKKTALKITRQQADQIRALKGVETSIATAARYGVTESNVRLIQDGKIWRHERKIRVYFTDDEVRAIRSSTEKVGKIAKKFNANHSAVWRIRTGRAYASVK